jgi:hypothetical protein
LSPNLAGLLLEVTAVTTWNDPALGSQRQINIIRQRASDLGKVHNEITSMTLNVPLSPAHEGGVSDMWEVPRSGSLATVGGRPSTQRQFLPHNNFLSLSKKLCFTRRRNGHYKKTLDELREYLNYARIVALQEALKPEPPHGDLNTKIGSFMGLLTDLCVAVESPGLSFIKDRRND